uniref:At1g61320/AtMIF1 LRR domain-containing protein n=1 Tax=Oryza punctata TaxID=4537 RepID=A0A0E0KY09_ORYPU
MFCSNPLERSFTCKIDSILRNHSSIDLKILRLDLDDDPNNFLYVDSWLQVAVTPRIEELTLMLYEKNNFPCSLLSDGVGSSIRYLRLRSCPFHPTVELGPLRSLTSLHLQSKLKLTGCKEIIFLKIPCVLQQLKSLTVMACHRLQVLESKAPNLSRIYLHRGKIKFSPGEALEMKDFTLSRANTLFLDVRRVLFILYNPPAKIYLLVTLLDPIFIDSISFVMSLQVRMEHESVFGGGSSSHLRESPQLRRHDHLKSVEVIGFSSAKGLVELTCCIINKAVSLQRLVLNTLRHGCSCCSKEYFQTHDPFNKVVLDEAFRAVAAIRSSIQDEVPPGVNLTVVEPYARCHSYRASSS